MDGVVFSGSKTHLLGFVRSLHHNPARATDTSCWIRNLPKDSIRYLSALRNVRSLSLVGIRIGHATVDCFSAFRDTLTDLSFNHFDTSFSAFVTLVDSFPNLTNLWLGLFVVKPDEEPVPVLSLPLRGRIHLKCFENNSEEFFDRLAELDPEYEELVLESEVYVEAGLVESILRLGASTVEYLRVAAEFDREHLHKTSHSLHIPLTQILTS